MMRLKWLMILGILTLSMAACTGGGDSNVEETVADTEVESSVTAEEGDVAEDEVSTEEPATEEQASNDEASESEEAELTEADMKNMEVMIPAEGEPGIYFIDLEDYQLYIYDFIEEGKQFDIATSGDFPVTVWAINYLGEKIAEFETEDGMVDYSEYVNEAHKIYVVGGFTFGKYQYYCVKSPGENEPGIHFEDQGDSILYVEDIINEELAFPASTSGDFAVQAWVVDADGNKLADLHTEEEGYLDYSEYAEEAARLYVLGGAADGKFVYEIVK